MKQIKNRPCRPLGLFLLLLAAIPAYLRAQTEPAAPDRVENIRLETNTAYLLAWAARDSARYCLERDSALRLTQQYGYPQNRSALYQEYALQGFDDSGQLRYYGSDNAISAKIIRTSELHPGGSSGYNLSGKGWTPFVWEISRPLASHAELNGRVTQGDNSFQSVGDHATHVSGTLIASGQNPAAKGMAYEANLKAFDANNDISEMGFQATQNARVSNHSYGPYAGWEYGNFSGNQGWHWWGNPTIDSTTDFKFGLYDSQARSLDNVAFNAPFYLPVRSAGNDRDDSGPGAGGQHWVLNTFNQWVSSTATHPKDGAPNGYDCMPPTGCAKNVLTVGAVQAEIQGVFQFVGMSAFSNWGPTDDGRIKPDLVARGVDVLSSIATGPNDYDLYAGTSMAAPAVAGSLLLLLQHYERLNPGFTIRAPALKALAIHTAEQLSGGNGPNYRSGWGLMNARAAADVISNSFYAGSHDRLFSRDSIAQGGVRETNFYHDGEGPFKVTLVWSDPPGPVSANELNPAPLRLVNDLDLRLIRQSDGAVYEPWILDPATPAASATKGDNTRDNVEQISEKSLPAGMYTVRVTHKGTLSGGMQVYSWVVSGRASLYADCSGTISSNPDSAYLNNSKQSWTIAPPGAVSVTLHFNAFDTESGQDIVSVYDGTSRSAPLLGAFSGNTLPPDITASSGKMFVVFETNISTTRSGWAAAYACQTDQVSVSPVPGSGDALAVRLFPNPAADFVRLELQSSRAVSAARLELYATDGRFIGRLFEGDLAPGGAPVELPLAGLPAGLYRYRFIAPGEQTEGQLAIGGPGR